MVSWRLANVTGVDYSENMKLLEDTVGMPDRQLPQALTLTDLPEMAALPRSRRSNSPFRYPGGKYYARRLILDALPTHERYCEPFAGGASVFFAKTSAAMSILNDADGDVINTLRCIRDRVESLIELLEGVPIDKEHHRHYKEHYEPTTGLERAFRWFYLNRTSYSGIMRAENCYFGWGRLYSMLPENWGPHLRTCSDKLQGTELLSLDFEDAIDALPNGTLAFVDPPYWSGDQRKFYNCTFNEADHLRLRDCLERNSDRLLFLLTYDDCEAIRDLYSWAPLIQVQTWHYTINRTDDQRN